MLSLSTSQLASIAGAVAMEGEREGVIKAIAALNEAGPDDLSFLGNAKYTAEVARSKAGVILVPKDYVGQPAPQQVFLRVEKPSFALALVCAAIEAQLWPKPKPGIHPTAAVDATAKIDSKINFVLDEIINAPFLRTGVQEVYWSSSDSSLGGNGNNPLANYAWAEVVLIVSDGKQLQMKSIKRDLLPKSTLANVKAVRAF